MRRSSAAKPPLALHDETSTSDLNSYRCSLTARKMSNMRLVGPRFLRPNLSHRYLVIRRAESTSANVFPIQPRAQSLPAPRRSFFRRNRGNIVLASLALALGSAGGNFAVHSFAPPPMPEPGTHGDAVLLADINRRIDEDFKVKVLRGKCLGVPAQLRGEMGGWVELVPDERQEMKPGWIASLGGAKGLSVERLFWSQDEAKLVAVIWFGGSLSGWPGVTHGGVIATQLAEKCGLAAALAGGSLGDVSSAAIPQRLPGTGNHAKMLLPPPAYEEPKQLSLSYVKPTYANAFYVVRVSPTLRLDQEPEHVVPPEPASGTHEWEATLETLDARVLVKAKAKLAPSTRLERMERRVGDGTRWSYEQFKEWMWPSRQGTTMSS